MPTGESGMYGLVFDNTFSKQTSKTVHFVLITHPVNAPPKSGHHLHYAQAFSESSSSVGKRASPMLRPLSDSNESLPQTGVQRGILEDPRPRSKSGPVETRGIEGTTFYTGVLNKRRRKKGRGYAKRFFSLDFTSSTLSYYQNRHSSALRGAVPLSLAAVGANEKTREFSVDSGAEVWHLKALNKKDFEGWRDALERASAAVGATSFSPSPVKPLRGSLRISPPNPAEDHEWARLEQLVSKVAGTRDAVRALAKDTDPKYLPGSNGTPLGTVTSRSSSNAPSPTSYEQRDYFPESEDLHNDKRPFWRRRPSERQASAERRPASTLFKRSASAQLTVPPSFDRAVPISPLPLELTHRRPSFNALPMPADVDVHERCMAVLQDLNSVVSDFATLIAESRARRIPAPTTTESRMSIDSFDDQEFFDAEDMHHATSLLNISKAGEADETHDEPLFGHDSDAESDSSTDDVGELARQGTDLSASKTLFSALPDSLPPLPLSPVKRRSTITPLKHSPPSIIGFLRKNAGKDLSTVSMPVTANEPTSLLQRLAESMEYSPLLDAAASTTLQPEERLMYVAAFAVSYFAYNRVKERALRKPFNPMLGESFELVREDLGFRFVAEKVSHHPVRMACQAESLNNGGWSFAQSPQPVQKFWGKSVELNTEGRAYVVLHAPHEQYSWSQATCFLRNVIAGEKYVEPVQSMTIVNETNRMRAVATFKAGGMFSGRSEEVTIQLFDAAVSDTPLQVGLSGKWTEGLKRTDTGDTIWKVGSLVPDASKAYGFTAFAATLNEITEAEKGHLPPTDSRLRPDQQALERGEVDAAEALKARLEERQRARRKVLEAHGRPYEPLFFEKVAEGSGSGEERWRLKEHHGYWERRLKKDWSGVQEVFEV